MEVANVTVCSTCISSRISSSISSSTSSNISSSFSSFSSFSSRSINSDGALGEQLLYTTLAARVDTTIDLSRLLPRVGARIIEWKCGLGLCRVLYSGRFIGISYSLWMTEVWMTIWESGWNLWVWLVGVVSRRWV